MKRTLQLISIALFLIIQSFDITAQDTSNRVLNQVDSLFTSHYTNKIPGSAFAVIKNGEVLLQKTIGLATLFSILPQTPNSLPRYWS